MTITEAAREVLHREKRAMTIEEIYDAIVAGKLATFKSAQPRGVLRNLVRRHTEGIAHAAPAKVKYFVKVDETRFALKEPGS